MGAFMMVSGLANMLEVEDTAWVITHHPASDLL